MPGQTILDPEPRPTLRQLADSAGVSPMTVSRALGGRGRVAAATRRRIVGLAESLGYRPDPEIAKLMHHLRSRRTRRFQSVVVGLSTRHPDDPEFYFRALAAGARARLADRGFGFELRQISAEAKGWSGFGRMLRNRGVEGILVLPQLAPVDLTALLDWCSYSVVSASASAVVPFAERVLPHHFANAVLLCRTLSNRGFRRIGLVIAADHDRRTEHGFTAGVTWHGLNEAAHFVPPLVTVEARPAPVRSWVERERPDAIITSEPTTARLCARMIGPTLAARLQFFVTSRSGQAGEGFPGIDERPAEIGAAAADLLAGMVERRHRLRPGPTMSTLLTGRWLD